MGNSSPHDLPYHFLRIERGVVGRKKEKGDARMAFQVLLCGFGVMEAYIVQYDNEMPSWVLLADCIKESLKCCCIACICDLPCQIPRIQIHRAKQGLAFFLSKTHRDDGLYSFQTPHTGQGRH